MHLSAMTYDCRVDRRRSVPKYWGFRAENQDEEEKYMYVPLKALLAVIAGVVGLLSPKLFRVAVSVYLIAVGVLGLLGR